MTFKLIKASVATLALLAVPFAAQAADVPIKAPYYKGAPHSVVSYYNWTGFYAGVNAGYGWGSSDWSAPAASIKPKGFLAGGTLGYNWQSGAIVYGIEGDFDWSDVKASVACAGVLTCETSSSWLATFRGRVGYAFDRWLPYVTGGGAYGRVKATLSACRRGLGLGVQQPARLDHRRRSRIRLHGQLVGQARISLRRSRQLQRRRCPGGEQRQLQGKHRSCRSEL